jgi:transposase-like protein
VSAGGRDAPAPPAASAGGRAQPFYCPYCGETDIRPAEAHAEYHCQICDRLWRLSYQGLLGSAGA